MKGRLSYAYHALFTVLGHIELLLNTNKRGTAVLLRMTGRLLTAAHLVLISALRRVAGCVRTALTALKHAGC